MADAAFVVLRLLIPQDELEPGEKSKRDVSVDGFIATFLFFHVEREQTSDLLVEGIVLFDLIGLMQLECVDPCRQGQTIFVFFLPFFLFFGLGRFGTFAFVGLGDLGMRVLAFGFDDFFGFGLGRFVFGLGSLSIFGHG